MSNFVHSFGAANHLLVRAHSTGSLIEALVLYVSCIDGFLRIAIVLDKQLAGDAVDVDDYVQQVPGGAKFTERAIYEEASRRGLIDDALRAEVVDLYEQRNAIVHRFFLTGLRYADLGPLLDRYDVVYDRCAAIVAELETRQVRDGKGMTVTGQKPDRSAILADVKGKLGFDADLAKPAPPPKC